MAKGMNLCEKISALVKSAIEDCGCTLWDVDYVKDGKNFSLIIYIDKEGGVALTDCEMVNAAIDPIIEAADPIQESYFLEISSPGIERDLKTKEHITAFLGKEIIIKFYAPRDGAKSINGVLISFDAENDILTINNENIERRECASIKSVCNL